MPKIIARLAATAAVVSLASFVSVGSAAFAVDDAVISTPPAITAVSDSVRPYPAGPFKPCSAAKTVQQPALGKFYAYAMDAVTGRVLVNLRGTESTPSASVLKVLTAAAAMRNLPSTYRAETKIFTDPAEPGTIYVRGGGDHTLSRMTGESFTTYWRPARLETLAKKFFKIYPVDAQITKIVLDSSFFEGDTYNRFWKASDRTNGYISHITALQIDGDRANPDLTSKKYNGYRSTDPVLAAGRAIRAALGDRASSATLTKGLLPPTAIEITKVSSQTINTWLIHALGLSDNTETEFIARHAALAASYPASFDSIQPMVKQVLAELKISSAGLVMKDGSGLSQLNRVTPKLVAQLMAKVANSEEYLGNMEGMLPVAGRTGTLAGRFTGYNAVARGFVKAKSGYIPGLYSLAGIIDSKDGGRIAFAIFARSGDGKTVSYLARPALDSVAAKFYRCGLGLTL